ncbi:MAG: ArsR/SmtB family transcription factor [Cellulosilyticaceae bacterium]
MQTNCLEAKADILKALAHPARLCITANLYFKGKCNVTNIQHCMEMPQSTISQHLAKLKSAGIIKGVRNGLEIEYEVVNQEAIGIIETLFPSQCPDSLEEQSNNL